MNATLHTPDTIYSPRHVPSWFLLAAAAGFVNALAFVACEQFVSHVTGTVSLIGLEWPQLGVAAEYASVVVSLVVGAAVSVVWLQARAKRGRRPRWATPLAWVALLLVGVAFAGHAGYFGPFGGTSDDDSPPALLLSLLAFAMGLQNAAVATTTGLAVRTTHLTGPSTDFGVHLGTAAVASGEERRAALRGAWLRGGKVAAFMAGAALSLPLSGWLGFLAFLVPAAFVVVAALLSFSPEWSPSDYLLRPSAAATTGSDEKLAGMGVGRKGRLRKTRTEEPSKVGSGAHSAA